MSDHDEQPSRRRVLQAGLFALAATQMPDGLVARAQAQGVKRPPLVWNDTKSSGAPLRAQWARKPRRSSWPRRPGPRSPVVVGPPTAASGRAAFTAAAVMS